MDLAPRTATWPMPYKSRISSGDCSRVSWRSEHLTEQWRGVIKCDSYLTLAKKFYSDLHFWDDIDSAGNTKTDENKKNRPSIIRQILTRIMRVFYALLLLYTYSIGLSSVSSWPLSGILDKPDDADARLLLLPYLYSSNLIKQLWVTYYVCRLWECRHPLTKHMRIIYRLNLLIGRSILLPHSPHDPKYILTLS